MSREGPGATISTLSNGCRLSSPPRRWLCLRCAWSMRMPPMALSRGAINAPGYFSAGGEPRPPGRRRHHVAEPWLGASGRAAPGRSFCGQLPQFIVDQRQSCSDARGSPCSIAERMRVTVAHASSKVTFERTFEHSRIEVAESTPCGSRRRCRQPKREETQSQEMFDLRRTAEETFLAGRYAGGDSAKTHENPVRRTTCRKTDEFPVRGTAAFIGRFAAFPKKG